MQNISLFLLMWVAAGTTEIPNETVSQAPLSAADAYLDGGRARLVTRVGESPRWGLLEIEVHEAETGLRYPAWLDEHAIVQLAPWAREDARRHLEGLGLERIEPVMESAGLWRVAGIEADGLALSARLRRVGDPALVEVMPDLHLMLRRAQDSAIDVPPDDPRYSGQWFFDKLDMEEAWALSTGAPDVEILVVDNGCDPDHPDLVEKYEMGIDVVDNDFLPAPVESATCVEDADCDNLFGGCEDGLCRYGNEHGTACAGLVAASTDNGIGIAGGCPQCRVRCARLLNDDGAPTPISANVAAFDYAYDQGVAVVSNSWGFNASVSVPFALSTAIQQVYDNGRGGLGALVLFAAGNDNREIAPYELVAVRGVLGIGAVTNFDEVTSFSNSGASVDLVAPTGTLTTDISGDDGAEVGDYTNQFGGTSSACPVAAGVSALVVAAAPELTSEEIVELLVETARPAYYAQPDEYGHDDEYGFGIIDPVTALRTVLGLETGDGDEDAGTIDVEDAGGGDGGTGEEIPPECGCSSGADASPVFALAGLLLAFTRRRRRSR